MSVQVFQWYRTPTDIPAIDMANSTSAGTGIQLRKREELHRQGFQLENMIVYGV